MSEKKKCAHRKTYILQKLHKGHPFGRKSKGTLYNPIIRCVEKCVACKKTLMKWRPRS